MVATVGSDGDDEVSMGEENLQFSVMMGGLRE
jgi:hypothetical protein